MIRIGRLHILWEKENETVLIIPRKISRVEEDRIKKLLSRGYHVHANPVRKTKLSILDSEPKERPEVGV